MTVLQPAYLSVDPGKGAKDSIGWAMWDNKGDLLRMGQSTLDDFVDMLENLDTTRMILCIWEEYRIFAKRAIQHTNSKVETAQSIGYLKTWCYRKTIPYIEQKPDILTGAARLFGVEMPKDHTQSHQFSAMLHGLHYLRSQKLAITALEREYAKRTQR